MGGGAWSASTYTSSKATHAAAGIGDFDYSDRISSGTIAAVVNPLLDPATKAGTASPFAGKIMREVTITDEHPNPTAVALVLDVTGSNFAAAQTVHKKLPLLFGVLQRIGGIEDPQVLVSFIGDATCDRVPWQVGQFESDNRIDAMIEAAYLEGGGGGQMTESYELAAYYLARHTHLEPWHKQCRKGYAFFIGDELPYPKLVNDFGGGYYRTKHTLESLTGDKLVEDLDTKDIFEELKEQYDPFFLFQVQGSYPESRIMPTWRDLLTENALILEDPDNVCEFIAGLLAIREGGLDLDEAADVLTSAGFDKDAIASVSKTLATVGGGSGGAVAAAEGSLDLGDSGGKGTSRV
jgi:hypothetical protein